MPRNRPPSELGLGRRTPTDWKHIEKYPLRSVQPETAATVERVLRLPRWHWSHDQGQEGSCVGHGCAMERAIVNTRQNKLAALIFPGRRYSALDIWNQAKEIDEWPDTNPGDDNGTSVRAAYDVLRDKGARRIRKAWFDEVTKQVQEEGKAEWVCDLAEGVASNRWATTVDEMRTAIENGLPVTIGVNWYSGADDPVLTGKSSWWILKDGNFGHIRGGHCVCVYGASDARQAFRVKNSWGRDYPLVWLPYASMERLLAEDGEAALVTDR